jgi:hypothetical protein
MGALNSLATLGLNVAMAQRDERADQKALAQERDRRTRDLLQRAASDRREQDEALRRRLAQARVRAATARVSGAGGSIDAVLRGLAEEGRADRAAANSALENRLDALRATHAARRRTDLTRFNSRWIDAGARTLTAFTGGRRSLLD